MSRMAIVAAAREWIGTPYQHQASLRGIGADCIGLVRGIWRECIGPEPETLPIYSPNWHQAEEADQLLSAMHRHFEPCTPGRAQPGGVLVFRMKVGSPVKHCGILSTRSKIIHAYWGRGVTETHLVPWWQRRIAAAFSFPNF